MPPLACSCPAVDDSTPEWCEGPSGYSTLQTKRPRRCASCGEKIEVGSLCARFPRKRWARTEIEERIYGDEVPLAPRYLCERCADIFFSLEELGFCVSPEEDMRALLEQYHEEYGR